MKIVITLKDPDVLHDAIDDALGGVNIEGIEERKNFGIM